MDACLQQDMFPKMMEHLPASAADAVNASLALIDEADIYVGVLAYRYGYVPQGFDISITEMEYDRAVERDVPRLIFLMDENHPVSPKDVETGKGAEQLKALKRRVQDSEIVNFFSSPEDLRAHVVNSLSKLRPAAPTRVLAYSTAVVEMIAPTSSPLGAVLNRLEPYPGFPYFSHESDHPSQWPPRVHQDRNSFFENIASSLSGEVAAELAAWREVEPPSIEMPGKGPDDPELNYALLRNLLSGHDGNLDIVAQRVGPQARNALANLETARRELEESMPNRLLMLRVRNQTDEDIADLTIEAQVAGDVYDVTVNAEGEQERTAPWKPGRFTIDVPLLRPGYLADVRVWYFTLPLESRVFAGPMDYKWAETEGIVVENLAASGAKILATDDLLDDLSAYHRYPVDPVRSSDTFGWLGDREAEDFDEFEIEAEVPHAVPRPAGPIRVTPPTTPGPYALLLALAVRAGFRQKADAYETQAAVANTLSAFREALDVAGPTAVFEYEEAVEADYSPYAGEYRVTGQHLAIQFAPEYVDLSAIAGVDGILAVGSIAAEFVPWEEAQYEVVLHFFADPMDARGDSKRLITQKLALNEIFDVTASSGEPANSVSPEFADLMRFACRRLEAHYGESFTLDDQTGDTAPFYLVVRHEDVSENFYLPREWMSLANDETELTTSADVLVSRLSRLYDYADNSRELTADEFGEVFHR